ncbi:unnamed protein product [marine sediment metagenome]|uniref:Uncharacterized protein n=1 Tax=marine sediment metagenome TaxID=412755 RepID=X1CWD4_9ZZZZ
MNNKTKVVIKPQKSLITSSVTLHYNFDNVFDNKLDNKLQVTKVMTSGNQTLSKLLSRYYQNTPLGIFSLSSSYTIYNSVDDNKPDNKTTYLLVTA